MELRQLLDEVNGWRARQGIQDRKPLNEKQIEQFCADLHRQVDKFSVRPERVSWGKYEEATPPSWKEDSRVISYSGKIGDVDAWRYARAMSEGGKGDVHYISDTPAGQLLNSEKLRVAVQKAVGGFDGKFGEQWQGRIFNGHFTPDWAKRLSPNAIGDKPALDDLVSARMMRTQAYGDVRSLTATAASDRVFRCSELRALMENEKVTAINAVPKAAYIEIYRTTSSLDAVHRAVATASMTVSAGIRAEVSGSGKSTKVGAVDTTRFYTGTGYPGVSVPREKTNVSFDEEYRKLPDYKVRTAPQNFSQIQHAVAAVHARAKEQRQPVVQAAIQPSQTTMPARAAPERSLGR